MCVLSLKSICLHVFQGNRLLEMCGQRPSDLCKPCEPGTFTVNPLKWRCERCSDCVGAQVHVKNCTAIADTVCGCKEGLRCANDKCSYCVEKCRKGFEPLSNGSCRPCPEGTFSDQIDMKCKPWSTKCPKPDQVTVVKGNASSDIQCVSKQQPIGIDTTTPRVEEVIPRPPAFKIQKAGKKMKKQITKSPVIRTPTDEPRTLIAIECSFHEAQQEQGSSSTESLISK
ncbi:Tumor necrosis factor receptor superfamily member 9 [Oryzias melastigma]|uniref:Tumor necrosis factor receptor superfamily member 9 n=1 Tax=Oryzias melastigma TaxID=30732 RepID=A0A834BWF9_ORYME|nr:Tumor necrosis factor receptor superfamily member 9 [Oryzias melastigma]